MRPIAPSLVAAAALVATFLASSGARAEDPPPQEPSSYDDHWGELSLEALVGARRISVGAFDAPLRASGYGALPRTFAGGGFALDLSIARWRFEIPMLYTVASAPSLVDSSSVGAAVGDVRIDFGYDLIRAGDFTAFALGGLGVSSLMMDTRDPHWSWVATRTQVSSDVNTVEEDTFVLGLQAGLQQVVPLGGTRDKGSYALYLGVRGGYQQQLADVGWMTSGSGSRSVGGLPTVDVSGGWMALSIGIGMYGPRLRAPAATASR